MSKLNHWLFAVSALVLLSSVVSAAPAEEDAPSVEIELEGGAVWQSRNDVQIPNDGTGTRFSLVDAVGKGPWPALRLYLTWNINDRHGLRALLAPLSITETGSLDSPVDFAGETFLPGEEAKATYKFNSWRLGYRYKFFRREDLGLWIGFTAKIRDAKIELKQGSAGSRKTDVGFVPLLHLAADWKPGGRFHLLFDFDGLAGGPGRAFDISLKLGYDLPGGWMIAGGYRTLEGGADVESVYNFAWLHYGAASVFYRF